MNKTNNGKRLMAVVAVLALIACAFVAIMPASEQVNGAPVADITVPPTATAMDSVDDLATTTAGNYVISSPITLDKNVTIATGVNVYIITGGILTVPAGFALTVTGTLSVTDGGVFTFNAGEDGYNVAITETSGKISIDETGVANITGTGAGTFIGPNGIFVIGDGQIDVAHSKATDGSLGMAITVKGTAIVAKDFGIYSADKLTVNSGAELTVNSKLKISGTLTNSSSIAVGANGQIEVDSTSVSGVTSAASLADTTATKTFYYGTPQNVTLTSNQTYSITSGSAVVKVGTNVVSLGNIDSETAITVATTDGTAMAIAGGKVAATGTVAMTSGTATVTAATLGSVLDGYVTSNTFGKSLTDVGAADAGTPTKLKAAVTVYGDKSTDIVLDGTNYITVADGSSITGTVSYTDGTNNTVLMSGTVGASGANAVYSAATATGVTITCTNQMLIFEDATINQNITVSCTSLVLNGTTTFGTAGKITATGASVYCNGTLAGTTGTDKITAAAYYGDYNNLSQYATMTTTPAASATYKGASAWSVESIEDIEAAISNGFNNFNVETGKTLTIDEPWTLGEGYTIFVTGTIAVTGTATFTIADGAQVIMMVDSAKITVEEDARMNVGGDIIGYQGTTLGTIENSGTVSFDNSAEVKTDFTGNGTFNLSDSMKTVYVREDVNSNLTFLPQQTVIVESGYNINISSTSRMDVLGNLIVEEGASINVTKGGLLYVRGNTASATIDGTVTSNGMSIMTADGTVTGTPLAGVTINITSAQSDDSVIAINGTLQSRACNGELAIDLKKTNTSAGKGSIELTGALTIAANSMAQFDGMEVLEGGVLTVNGTIGDTHISNAGTVVMNGTSNGTFTIDMEIGGIVDVKSLAGDMTVTDSGMFLTMVRDDAGKSVKAVVGGANAKWASVANSIELSDIKGAYITSDAPYEVVDGYDSRMPVNKMYVSGNLTPVTADANATATVVTGTVIVPDLEAETDLNVGKTHLGVSAGATLDVIGFVAAVDSENTTAFTGAGDIVVSEGTVKSLNVIDGPKVTAVHYEALESNVTYNYYTTLAKAIASGATEMDAIGDLTILEDITLPTGFSLTATNVYVGDEDVQDITFTVENDAEFTAANVYVYATMDVADTNDVFVSAIYSDTETIDGTHAVYTNLATALANAQDSTVTITKRGDGTVYLSTDATVKDGVTLAIPAGKVLEIKNGVTLTVAGTVDNKGEISAYYTDEDGAIQNGTFGTEVGTGSDVQKKAVIALEGGLIQSTLAMDYDDGYYIAGAYYTIGNGRTNVITTIEKAAPVILTADSRTVSTYGEVVGTTATFTGEEYYNATLYVYGDLTMDSLVLKDTQMTVQADASILNGAFGSDEGSVTFEHVQVAKGFYLADRIVESGDAKVPTLFMNGTVTKDLDSDFAFVEALVQFDGAVKVVNVSINLNGAIEGVQDTENGNVVIAASADVAFAKNLSNDNMAMTVSNLDLTVEGTLTVSSGAQLTATKNVINVVLGTLAIAERTDSQSAGTANISVIFIGGVPEDVTYDSTRYAAGIGADAAVTGVMSGLNAVYLFPGSTIAEKNVEGFYSTTFMVEDAELVTVYTKTQAKIDNIYPTALIGNSLFKGWYYEDANGVMQPAGKNTLLTAANSAVSEYKTEVTIGQYATVYANVDFDSYMLEFHVDAGVDAIYVDGDIVDSKGLVGQGSIQYPVAWVSAGEHTITVKLSNGYTGVVEMSFGGQTVTDGKISITGGDYAGTTYVVSITNIDASQTTPSESTGGSDDGMGLTDYLLIILVILIVIMAIMVALRLMRS